MVLDTPPCLAVIDDDVSIRRSLGGLIRSLGYDVKGFASAESFLGEADPGRFDCILTDMNMPGGMTGLELIDRLRAGGNLVPVILISAYMDDMLHSKAQKAGFICTMKKPFSGQNIIDCLGKVIDISE